MKKMILALLLLIMMGCATAPGRFTKDDFAWTVINLPVTYQESYRRMAEGFRRCAINVDKELFTDTMTGHFDLFLSDMLGGKSAWVLGVVDITSVPPGGSVVQIGITHKYDSPLFGRPGKARDNIARFAFANYSKCE
jgi:hypothetical protein